MEQVKDTPVLSDSDRLKRVMAELGFKKQKDFAAAINVSAQEINFMIDSKSPATRNMSEKVRLNIVNKFPQISYLFLKSGQLPVLNPSDKTLINQRNLLGTEKPFDGTPFEINVLTQLVYANKLAKQLLAAQEDTNDLLRRIANKLAPDEGKEEE